MPPAQTTQTPCPACGSHHGMPLAHNDGKTGEPLTVMQCAGCGLGRVDPMPTAEELAAWYSKKYRQDYKASVTPRLTHVLRAGRLARDRWRWAQQQLPHLRPKRSLDVGASSGEFVYLLQSQGVQAMGLEPHEGYSSYARSTLGLDMVTGALQDRLAELPRGSYDLVSMFHVLEHLTDPIASLRALGQLLNPEGVLLIEVPNVARLSSPKNTFFKAHTLYFSPHSLRDVARAAGLKIVASDFSSTSNLLVLLQPCGEAATGHWQPDNSLLQAQADRSWPKYLMNRIASGYLFQRLRHRRNEKDTAAAFRSAKELLDGVYSGQVS